MSFSVDRFETRARDCGGRVVAGWRIRRYSWGAVSMQHLRTGRALTGVIDDFGNIALPVQNAAWRMDTEEIIPFYREAMLPPHWKPGMSYRT